MGKNIEMGKEIREIGNKITEIGKKSVVNGLP